MPKRETEMKDNPTRDNPTRYMGLGVELMASIVGPTLLGWWLDREFGTEPWLVVCGMLMGLVGGFYNLLKTLLRLGQPEPEEQKTGKEEE